MNIKTEDNLAVSSGLDWRTSTKCASDSCVEVAKSKDKVYIRSSKGGAASAYLVFDADEWRSFLTGVHDHEFEID
jgi:hypothetical protein